MDVQNYLDEAFQALVSTHRLLEFSNRLPPPETMGVMLEDETIDAHLSELDTSLAGLADDLATLSHLTASGTHRPAPAYSGNPSAVYIDLAKWRDSVIEEFDAGALNAADSRPLLQQIAFAAQDADVHSEKLFVNRSGSKPLGRPEALPFLEKSAFVLDDTDFYTRLVNKFSTGGSGTVDPILLAKQARELRRLRRDVRERRKYDRKMTKGRRIKYTITKKLVDFAAGEGLSERGEMTRANLVAVMPKRIGK